MELLESNSLNSVVEKILESRRKCQDIRWKMLLRDGSSFKSFFGSRPEDMRLNNATNPSVDAEVADIVYSHLKHVLLNDSTVAVCGDNVDNVQSFQDVMGRLMELRRHSMEKHMSTEIQVELAFLWRTQSVLKSMDDGFILNSFYDEFLGTIKRLSSLSLSNVWMEQKDSSKCDDPTIENRAEIETKETQTAFAFAPIKDLAYLHDDPDATDEHDPYGLVKRFFESIEQFSILNSHANKSNLLSVCVALAVKSGRLSLLLRAACLLLAFRDDIKDMDVHLLDDVVKYVVTNSSSASKLSNDSKIVHPSGKSENTSGRESRYSRAYGLRDAIKMRQGAGGLVLSFGKADHGKLGLGDTQVTLCIN